MKFEPVSLSEAKRKILGHNIAGANRQRLWRKGSPLTNQDLEKLRTLGRSSVYAAAMEPDDVEENKAARRVAETVCGPGLHINGIAAMLGVDGGKVTRTVVGVGVATAENIAAEKMDIEASMGGAYDSAAYRPHLAKVMTKRALILAAERAGG
jgi:hypothetical protein